MLQQDACDGGFCAGETLYSSERREMGKVFALGLDQKPRSRYQLFAVFAKNNTIKDNPICATEADKRASPSKNGTMILLRKIRKREASGTTLIYDLQNLEQIWGKKTFVLFVNKSIDNTSFSTSFMIQRQYFNVSVYCWYPFNLH